MKDDQEVEHEVLVIVNNYHDWGFNQKLFLSVRSFDGNETSPNGDAGPCQIFGNMNARKAIPKLNENFEQEDRGSTAYPTLIEGKRTLPATAANVPLSLRRAMMNFVPFPELAQKGCQPPHTTVPAAELMATMSVPVIDAFRPRVVKSIVIKAGPNDLAGIFVHNGQTNSDWMGPVELPPNGPQSNVFLKKITLNLPLNDTALKQFSTIFAPHIYQCHIHFYDLETTMKILNDQIVQLEELLGDIKRSAIAKIRLSGHDSSLDNMDFFTCLPVLQAGHLEIWKPFEGISVHGVVTWLKYVDPFQPHQQPKRLVIYINSRPELARHAWALMDTLTNDPDEPIEGPGFVVDLHCNTVSRAPIEHAQLTFKALPPKEGDPYSQIDKVWRLLRKGNRRNGPSLRDLELLAEKWSIEDAEGDDSLVTKIEIGQIHDDL